MPSLCILPCIYPHSSRQYAFLLLAGTKPPAHVGSCYNVASAGGNPYPNGFAVDFDGLDPFENSWSEESVDTAMWARFEVRTA